MVNNTVQFFIMKGIDENDPIPPSKLQYLLYYANGLHTAVFERALFADPIYATTIGPVILSVYDKYKGYWPPIISTLEYNPCDHFTEAQLGLLNDVWNEFGSFSAWKLRKMIQNHSIVIRAQKKRYKIISNKKLGIYFKKRLSISVNQC